MTKGDALVEKGARRLQDLSQRASAAGGLRARLAPTLADDAAFLRRLKPSLIAARARGEAPTDQQPSSAPVAPAGPQLGKRSGTRGNGPNPWLVLGAAFAVGIALAKLVDWRGHAHPRD